MPLNDSQITDLCIIFQVGLAVQVKPLVQVVSNRDFSRFKDCPGIVVFMQSLGKCCFCFFLGAESFLFFPFAFSVNFSKVKIV